MSNFNSGWYLIYTRPNWERKVANHLAEAGIDHFLATTKTFRKRNDQKKIVEAPLFPSYIFVFLRQLQDYYGAVDTNGVLYFIKESKKIALIKTPVIENLKLIVSAGTNLEAPADHFSVNETLLIKEGCLAGLSCEVVKYKNKDKILVRISLLNRCLLADMPVNYLIKPGLRHTCCI